jgi:hypothetical protein
MFKRKRTAEDFAEEIRAHLELEADELRSEGMSATLRHGGSPELSSEVCARRRKGFT